MGNLRNQIAKLCGEIVGSRRQRQALNQELSSETMLRRAAVDDMCSDFHKTRLGMARNSSRERKTYLDSLRRSVNAQRRDMQSDLAGVRRAWAGKSA